MARRIFVELPSAGVGAKIISFTFIIAGETLALGLSLSTSWPHTGSLSFWRDLALGGLCTRSGAGLPPVWPRNVLVSCQTVVTPL